MSPAVATNRAIAFSLAFLCAGLPRVIEAADAATSYGVGPQYDTTHVYVAPTDMDAFVNSFTATFGGKPSKRGEATVTPTPSSTLLQYVWTPVGTLSTFGFKTPVPYPFGLERTGYLVTDLDKAVAAAQAAGADVIVDAFKDPIGRDAVVQWPGGVNMQFYWHFTPPSYEALQTVPENRVYVSAARADAFVAAFVRFSGGKIVADDPKASAAEIGLAGQTYRRIRIESTFGKMQVSVTDGHLPYPFGHEMTGYEVKSLAPTLEKARSTGATLVFGPIDTGERDTAVVSFPGGYVAEIHDLKAH